MAMETDTLTVNIGSSSKKYAFYRDGKRLLFGHYESSDAGPIVTYNFEPEIQIDAAVYENALSVFLAKARADHAAQIHAVGIRVVILGEKFSRHRLIDAAFRQELAKEAEYDPLHVPPVMRELAKLDVLLPRVQVIAASDSAFHQTMPRHAREYALPQEVAKHFDIARTGFHGLSVASIVSQVLAEFSDAQKMVVCHMGGGTSVTAVVDGKSIANTMGYSPLAGIPMSTRIGDIDPEVVLRLASEATPKEVRAMLYEECGLLALSGLSADMRTLRDEATRGNERAQYAIDVYSYALKTSVGAYAAAMGGIDTLVFSGTIGMRSPMNRMRVAEGLEYLGIKLNKPENDAMTAPAGLKSIGDSSMPVRVLVATSDEEQSIFNAVMTVLQ